MKTVKSLIVAASVCAAFSFPAFGATSSQEQSAQQGQTVRLAYYGTKCWWHHGVRYCRTYNRPYYYQRQYYHQRNCYKGYYGRWHCR